MAGWEAWRERVLDHYREQGRRCPLNVVTSQLGRSTPGAQAVVIELIAIWQGEITAGIRHMQATGEIATDVDPDRSAAALVAGIQGGVLIMLSTGGLGHLEAALRTGIDALRRGRNQ